jgi:hypothetical protein
MWRNPKFFGDNANDPRERREAPEMTGTPLLAFPREQGEAELRLSKDTYKGTPILVHPAEARAGVEPKAFAMTL